MVLIAMMVITVGLVIAAVATGGEPAIVGYNLIWGYVLAGAAIAASIFCAIFGMINAPQGIKSTLISVGVAVVVVVASYLYANSHVIEILNIADGTFFPAWETVITEASILVTYITFGAVVLVAFFGQIFNTVEGLIGNKDEDEVTEVTE